MHNHKLVVAALAAGLSCSLTAQIPTGYLVVSQTNTAPDGFRIVNPATGDTTDIIEPAGNFLGGASCVAIDESTPNAIIGSAGGSFGGAPVVQMPLTDNFYSFNTTAGMALPMFGTLERMWATPNEILFTLSSVSDGVYSMPSIPGVPTLIAPLTDATDIAVFSNGLGTTAYVNSYLPGQPSTIIAIDLGTNAVTTLGTGYAPIRSLGFLNNMFLLAGREDGNIDLINVSTGAATPFAAPAVGPIIAIVDDLLTGTAYVATASGSVYSILDFTTPVYVSPHQLTDIDVARLDQATQLLYGSGCAGSGAIPQVDITPPPALGTTYTMQMSGAEPSTIGGIVLGYDRENLDLTGIGLPGCTLVAQNILIDAVLVDAAGGGSVSLPIPANNSLVGLNLNGQFFVLESSGNIAMTGGVEGQIR